MSAHIHTYAFIELYNYRNTSHHVIIQYTDFLGGTNDPLYTFMIARGVL